MMPWYSSSLTKGVCRIACLKGYMSLPTFEKVSNICVFFCFMSTSAQPLSLWHITPHPFLKMSPDVNLLCSHIKFFNRSKMPGLEDV